MAEDSVSVSGEQPAKKAFTAKALTIHLYSIGTMTDLLLYIPFGFLVVPVSRWSSSSAPSGSAGRWPCPG